jgi:CRP/FNR family transcriptional regulator
LVRLVRSLLERANEDGVLAITHHELAARVATTRESVTKAMRVLAADGLVRTGRGVVRLLDRDGLVAILMESDGQEP